MEQKYNFGVEINITITSDFKNVDSNYSNFNIVLFGIQ